MLEYEDLLDMNTSVQCLRIIVSHSALRICDWLWKCWHITLPCTLTGPLCLDGGTPIGSHLFTSPFLVYLPPTCALSLICARYLHLKFDGLRLLCSSFLELTASLTKAGGFDFCWWIEKNNERRVRLQLSVLTKIPCSSGFQHLIFTENWELVWSFWVSYQGRVPMDVNKTASACNWIDTQPIRGTKALCGCRCNQYTYVLGVL